MIITDLTCFFSLKKGIILTREFKPIHRITLSTFVVFPKPFNPLMMFRSVARSLFFVLCFITKAYSQSSCPPNLDFENGNFNGWQCFIGSTDVDSGNNRMLLSPSDPTTDRHTLITAADLPELDYYGRFPRLCPFGGNYSVKLGNEQTGAQAEALSYTFEVPTTVDTFTFTYFYAVVFQNPQHTLPEQPRFFVTAYDVGTGELINCASFDYVSTAGLPGFQQSTVDQEVLYKNWTPTSLQFAGLGGHNVRLEFRTADCTLTGHFGYAYLDIASACSNILATAPYCIETNSLILDAPFGFQSYTWYNSDFSTIVGSGQSMTFTPPPATQGVFYVDVIPYPGFGCRDSLQAFVKPMAVPDTPNAKTLINYCQLQAPTPLSAKALPGHTLLWYTSNVGGIGLGEAPVPSTTTPHTEKWYVSQKELFGCEGYRREITVKVFPTPVASFNINSNIRQCQVGNSFSFTSTSTNVNSPTYTWEFGDGQSRTSTNTSTVYSYPDYGTFSIKLLTTNLNSCTAEQTKMVTVIPKPIATFTYPTPICENKTLVTLTDASTVPQGISTINKWWWNVNGTIVQSKTPSANIAPPAGPFPVRFAVSTTEGCRSDTNTTVLRVRHNPFAAFDYGDLMCNNEAIRFTDRSYFAPGTTGEMVAKWYWTYDNTTKVSQQHPSTYFTAGKHKVRLISESSAGCTSEPVEHSFDIWPKPIVKLEISDSCIYVPITIKATDLVGNVVDYRWYFRGVTKEKENINGFIRTYYDAGDRPFTLYTLTDKGCKDTIYRPFTLYTNNSFAGKDTLAAFMEPVQLDAKGGPNMKYVWIPSTGLDRPDIEKPIATLDRDQRYFLYSVSAQGCKKQSQILVKRFAGPDLYVPNAFTPDENGINDKLKVKPVGYRSFSYFAIYNRWGQLVFRTTNFNEGWDGTINGKKAEAGTYVYVAQAIDYKGRPLNRKGTVILMR
jgi:gliding motility-associated-like protein